MKLKVYTKDGSSFAEQEFENIPQFEADKGLFALTSDAEGGNRHILETISR